MATKKPEYKGKQMQAIYETMLALAADHSSELYTPEGKPRRGGEHRCAFWDGYSGSFMLNGLKRSAHVNPGTISAACFMAGKEFARSQQLNSRKAAAEFCTKELPGRQ